MDRQTDGNRSYFQVESREDIGNIAQNIKVTSVKDVAGFTVTSVVMLRAMSAAERAEECGWTTLLPSTLSATLSY